jgi:hypothetical protein
MRCPAGASVSEQLAEQARQELAEGKTAEQIEREVENMSSEEVARYLIPVLN